MRKTISYALCLLLIFAVPPAHALAQQGRERLSLENLKDAIAAGSAMFSPFAAPVAASFSTAVAVNASTVIQLQGSDPDGTPLTYATPGLPSHGTLSQLNTATGAVVYTPAAGYTGSDSFTYTVTSGGDTTAAAIVTITVTAAKTRIIDTLTNPDGNPRKGRVTFILTTAAASPAGVTPANASVSAQLTSTGQFDVSVYPSRALSPQQYYQVWYEESGSLNRQLLGVYDIPASTTTITLAPYRVTDTNLAARYTFVSEASLKAAISAGSAQLLLGSDAPGDLYYRGSDGLLKRLPAGAAGQTLGIASGLPAWMDPDGGVEGLASQAVAYWKLDESGGAPYQNSVGSDVITPSGSFAGAGKVGSAPSFYHADSRYASAPDSAALSATAGQPLSLAFWYYHELDPTGNNPGVAAKTGGALNEYQVYFNKLAHRLGFTVWSGATATEVFTPTDSITAGAWNFVEAWHDPTAATINIRLNRGTTSSAAFAGTINDSNSPFQLGRSGGEYLSARIDELGLWKTVLSAQQSEALYNGTAGTTWPFSSSSSAASSGAKTYTFDIKEDFGASGSETTTTTSGSTLAGATSINVASAASFAVGQGLLIFDAGAGTDDYAGEITAVAGNTLTVTPATSRTVAAGTSVWHDDCGAMQASLDASTAGAKTLLPRGYYRCNRPLNPTTNSVLAYVMNGSGNAPYTAAWEGEFVTRTSENAPPTTGVVIDFSRISSKTSSGTFPSFLACKAYSDTQLGLAQFNYAAPELRNIYLRAGPNPQLSALNFNNCIDADVRNVQYDTNELFGSVTEPTNTQSTFLIAPGINNHAQITLEQISGFGFHNCYQFSEHVKFDVICSRAKVGIVATNGGHLNQGKAHFEAVPTWLKAPALTYKFSILATVKYERGVAAAGLWWGAVANKDIDVTVAGDVRGRVDYLMTQPPSGVTTNNMQSTNTSTFLKLVNLYTGAEH